MKCRIRRTAGPDAVPGVLPVLGPAGAWFMFVTTSAGAGS
jgi:hypothetical protein